MELSKPLIAELAFDGETYKFDVFELYALIGKGQDRFTNTGVGQYDFLCEKIMDVTGLDEVWYSQLYELSEQVVALVEKHKDDVKKKTELIASSADTTTFSPTDGESGPSGASDPG